MTNWRAAMVGGILLGCGQVLSKDTVRDVVSKDTLVVQQATLPSNLDPASTYDLANLQVIENIYETLWTYRGHSLTQLKPVLASEIPRYRDQGRTLVVKLRQKVKFHSGHTFSCADAEYTFRRNLITNLPDSSNWFLSDSLLGVKSSAAQDQRFTWARITAAVKCNAAGQLVFRLPQPDPAFLAKLAFAGQGMIDKQHAIALGEWDGREASWKTWASQGLSRSRLRWEPSGTGAYRLTQHEGHKVVLEAFAAYWGGRPALAKVRLLQVEDLTARQQAFIRGEADLIETGTRAGLEALRQLKGLRVLEGLPTVTVSGLIMNQRIEPGPTALLGSGQLDGQGIPADFFSDADLRRAFAYAFPYQAYIERVQGGQGRQRTMLLPNSFAGYSPSTLRYRFDPQQAKLHFQRAWDGRVWEKGFVLKVNYRSGHAAGQAALQLLKEQVEALNPKFHIELVEEPWSQLYPKLISGQAALYPISWSADYADPDNFLYTFYSSQGFFYPAHHWKNAQVDLWLSQARRTVSSKLRVKLYQQVADQAYQESPFIVLPIEQGWRVFRSNLQGVSLQQYNPMLSFSLTGTFWKDLSKN